MSEMKDMLVEISKILMDEYGETTRNFVVAQSITKLVRTEFLDPSIELLTQVRSVCNCGE